MKLSQRISSVAPSATIATAARAAQMKAEGVDVVSFGAGEPDFDTPQFIKEAAKAALDAGDTKYTPRSAKALKQAIVEKLSRENALEYSINEVIATFGGKNALYSACQVLIDPGDKVLLPAPYWNSYPEMIRLAGGEPVILETSEEDGFKISPRQILDAADRAKILILNYPSNPAGVTYTPQELDGLAQAVLKTDLIIFSDEIYEKLVYGGVRFVSFPALDGRLRDRTVIFSGLAKTYSMTGWRIGWAAGPKDVINAIARLMSHATTNPVSFVQAAALRAYTSPEGPATVEAMRKEFEKRAQHMAERLNAIDGVRCVPPTGALYCLPDVSAHYGRTLAGVKVTGSLTFAQAALEGVQVALVPGVAFGADQCVRLCFAAGMEQIDKGLDRLEKLLK